VERVGGSGVRAVQCALGPAALEGLENTKVTSRWFFLSTLISPYCLARGLAIIAAGLSQNFKYNDNN